MEGLDKYLTDEPNTREQKRTPKLDLRNCDCMELMAQFKDKHFDLAIVDPPYGINVHQNYGIGNRNDKEQDKKNWDNQTPNKAYFDELKRVSKEQIIWGANYFNCFNGKGGAIIWNKKQPLPDSSQCEIASYSRLQKVGMYEQRWTNFVNTKKTNHPTEKPIELYKWILKNYAEEGFKILDTHLGSGSIAVACHYLGFDLVASELDKEYFDAAKKFIKENTRQTSLF